MGQGVHTVALQVAAQELGIDPERIDVIVDTTRELGFGQTTGSRGTLMAAGSRAAGVRRRAGRRLRSPTSTTTASTSSTGRSSSATRTIPNPTIHAAFGYAAQMVVIDRDDAAPSSGSSPSTTSARRSTRCCARARSRAACTWASATRSPRTSRPIPTTGFPTNMTLRSLGILRAKDVPPIEVQLVEVPQPRSPYGIKGVGEIGLVPTAPAVAAALHDLDGEWRTSLPMRHKSAADD